jgi:hypothetical protein
MDLVYSTEQQAFRGEVRQWLEEHVPTTALESFDTAAGFEQHRQWEKTLAQGNWPTGDWVVI